MQKQYEQPPEMTYQEYVKQKQQPQVMPVAELEQRYNSPYEKVNRAVHKADQVAGNLGKGAVNVANAIATSPAAKQLAQIGRNAQEFSSLSAFNPQEQVVQKPLVKTYEQWMMEDKLAEERLKKIPMTKEQYLYFKSLNKTKKRK